MTFAFGIALGVLIGIALIVFIGIALTILWAVDARKERLK